MEGAWEGRHSGLIGRAGDKTNRFPCEFMWAVRGEIVIPIQSEGRPLRYRAWKLGSATYPPHILQSSVKPAKGDLQSLEPILELQESPHRHSIEASPKPSKQTETEDGVARPHHNLIKGKDPGIPSLCSGIYIYTHILNW